SNAVPFSSAFAGVPSGTGQANGSVMRYRNDAVGAVSVNVTVFVVALIPLTVDALPAITAGAAWMTLTNESPGDASFGENIRVNVYAMTCPVIGCPLANSMPGFIVKV